MTTPVYLLTRLLLTALMTASIVVTVDASPHHYARGKHYRNGQAHQHGYYHHYPARQRLSLLPHGYISLSYAGANDYYRGSIYYQHRGHAYSLTRPPRGTGISNLPAGYRTHYHGRRNYYSARGIFYQWNDNEQCYLVIDEPRAPVPGTRPVTHNSEQYVYPRLGQTSSQTSRDRYECYLWAAQQTGVEPAQINPTSTASALDDYQRANGACLEARGYSVK